MTDYIDPSFFLNSAGVELIECIEINHPSFSAPYRYMCNNTDPMVLGGNTYLYTPLQIDKNNISNDLEQGMSISFADIDDDFSKAVFNIPKTEFSRIRPTFRYFGFRDDQLDEPAITFQTLEIPKINKDSLGKVTFEARAPGLNDVATGKLYTFEDYPLLRGS
ncbi:hypothetical protein RFK95_12560 [Acinetobacter pittii]|uniref:hypothetical protein n=1 Tax=Acinetobacter TaxID=469 RepID=UPI0006468B86|nr:MULTISPECIES: hypothetical protein [Acinetobacter]MBM0875737.1 hypothetical protein [Acinetobacter pittii]MDQ9033698.1 hypothetical protein [Acinetobacter pittii]MDQ9078674.1 hypothetical protein [Acinetobacter pittii]